MKMRQRAQQALVQGHGMAGQPDIYIPHAQTDPGQVSRRCGHLLERGKELVGVYHEVIVIRVLPFVGSG